MLGGFRRRILELAAREADIVNLVPPGRSDMGSSATTRTRFKEKIAELESLGPRGRARSGRDRTIELFVRDDFLRSRRGRRDAAIGG